MNKNGSLLQYSPPNHSFIEADPTGDLIDRAAQCAQMFNQKALDAFMLTRAVQAEHALERKQKGLAGVCEDCGNPIPENRLAAKPDATRCIECQITYEGPAKLLEYHAQNLQRMEEQLQSAEDIELPSDTLDQWRKDLLLQRSFVERLEGKLLVNSNQNRKSTQG